MTVHLSDPVITGSDFLIWIFDFLKIMRFRSALTNMYRSASPVSWSVTFRCFVPVLWLRSPPAHFLCCGTGTVSTPDLLLHMQSFLQPGWNDSSAAVCRMTFPCPPGLNNVILHKENPVAGRDSHFIGNQNGSLSAPSPYDFGYGRGSLRRLEKFRWDAMLIKTKLWMY